MRLQQFLTQRRNEIIERWADRTLQVYAPDAARLMKKERDRFQNPVGRITRESLEVLFDAVSAGHSAEQADPALDGIIRIRAVQDLSPSEAVGFLFLLKHAVREELGAGAVTLAPDAVAKLDSTIDRLALRAFDLFTQCRQKIYELRLREIKQRASVLLERMDRPAVETRDEPADCGPCEQAKGGCGA